MKVYLFGNPLVEKDSLPLRLLSMLEKEFPEVEFLVSDPNEDPFEAESVPVIIDTVAGINEVTVLNLDDLAAFEKKVSLHDYDLGTYLLLKKKLGKIGDVVILGVPMGGNRIKIFEELCQVIGFLHLSGVPRSNLLAESESHRKYKDHKL